MPRGLFFERAIHLFLIPFSFSAVNRPDNRAPSAGIDRQCAQKAFYGSRHANGVFRWREGPYRDREGLFRGGEFSRVGQMGLRERESDFPGCPLIAYRLARPPFPPTQDYSRSRRLLSQWRRNVSAWKQCVYVERRCHSKKTESIRIGKSFFPVQKQSFAVWKARVPISCRSMLAIPFHIVVSTLLMKCFFLSSCS